MLTKKDIGNTKTENRKDASSQVERFVMLPESLMLQMLFAGILKPSEESLRAITDELVKHINETTKEKIRQVLKSITDIKAT